MPTILLQLPADATAPPFTEPNSLLACAYWLSAWPTFGVPVDDTLACFRACGHLKRHNLQSAAFFLKVYFVIPSPSLSAKDERLQIITSLDSLRPQGGSLDSNSARSMYSSLFSYQSGSSKEPNLFFARPFYLLLAFSLPCVVRKISSGRDE